MKWQHVATRGNMWPPMPPLPSNCQRDPLSHALMLAANAMRLGSRKRPPAMTCGIQVSPCLGKLSDPKRSGQNSNWILLDLLLDLPKYGIAACMSLCVCRLYLSTAILECELTAVVESGGKIAGSKGLRLVATGMSVTPGIPNFACDIAAVETLAVGLELGASIGWRMLEICTSKGLLIICNL